MLTGDSTSVEWSREPARTRGRAPSRAQPEYRSIHAVSVAWKGSCGACCEGRSGQASHVSVNSLGRISNFRLGFMRWRKRRRK
jgi:hypothetical protein